MSDDRTLALTRAYELIEAGKPDDAREILDSILEVEKNNADAWWIYAHAVDEPAAARDALENVLQLNPQYPGAGELLVVLREQYPDLPPSAIERRAVPKMPTDLPLEAGEVADDEPDFLESEADEHAPASTFEPEPKETARTGVLPWVAVAALAVIVVLALFLILSSINQPGSVEPTDTPLPVVGAPTSSDAGGVSVPTPESFDVQSASTEEATGEVTPEIEASPDVEVTVEVMMTLPGEVTDAISPEETAAEELPTETVAVAAEITEASPTLEMSGMGEEVTVEPSEPEVTDIPLEATSEVTPDVEPESTDTPVGEASEFEALSAALSSFTVPDSAFRQQTTSLGETLVASVCSTNGLELRVDLIESLSSLSGSTSTVSGVDAIAVEMVDCVSNTPLRLVGVLVADTVRFAAGELTEDEFEGLWRAL